ncbi:MAG: hypothetical protein ACNS61_02025 [Candidatus Wenzhouxiangella sp. M2_3B_020]
MHANAEEPDDPVPLFSNEGTIAAEISAPWRRLRREDEEDGPYPARIEYIDSDGRPRSLALTVERRGLTRQRICNMPPIKLRFDDEEVEGTLLEGNKSIKLVTHCKNGKRWEHYYVLEMLAYRIYNRITDMSFRVRPLSLTYRDSERGSVDGPRFAFMIEDDKLVGDRHGLDKLEHREISPNDLDAVETSRLALFQYLIGNVDWSALSGPGDECCHNAKLIGEDSLRPVFAVPYDFDSSGLVDAHYAVPPESLQMRDVSQRVFRGFCVHNEGLETARREFLDLEDELLALVQRETRISERDRKQADRYMREFFVVLNDSRRFKRQVIGDCRR